MPKPLTDMPGTMPGALAALTVTVVAAAVTDTPDWVRPMGMGVNARLDVAVADAA